jgi:hypothetical protein
MSGHGQGSSSKTPSGLGIPARLFARIMLSTYIISGSQNPRPNRPSQRQGSSNPSRVDNATGHTNTSHPSPSTGTASLPPRPATVAQDSSPRNAAPNYGFYRGSTLSSSMHIPPRQPIPSLASATNEPLKVTATKTSSKPSLASKSVGSNGGGGGGSGGGGGTESLSQATLSRSRFQPVSRYSIYLTRKGL